MEALAVVLDHDAVALQQRLHDAAFVYKILFRRLTGTERLLASTAKMLQVYAKRPESVLEFQIKVEHDGTDGDSWESDLNTVIVKVVSSGTHVRWQTWYWEEWYASVAEEAEMISDVAHEVPADGLGMLVPRDGQSEIDLG